MDFKVRLDGLEVVKFREVVVRLESIKDCN